jgi:hypothetical protein
MQVCCDAFLKARTALRKASAKALSNLKSANFDQQVKQNHTRLPGLETVSIKHTHQVIPRSRYEVYCDAVPNRWSKERSNFSRLSAK